jgi:hypothetical protein
MTMKCQFLCEHHNLSGHGVILLCMRLCHANLFFKVVDFWDVIVLVGELGMCVHYNTTLN